MSQKRDMEHPVCGFVQRVGQLLWLAEGNVIWVRDAGVGELYFGAVGGFDGVVGQGPVFGVGDGACGLGFDVEVVETEVFEGSVGVGADFEGGFGAGGFNVPDVDVAEVWKSLLLGDFGGEGEVVGWWVFDVGGQGGVAVTWVPVHGDVDGDGYAFEGEVVDADVAGVAAAGVGGFEEDS